MMHIPSARWRAFLRIALPFAAIPALVALGALVFPQRAYLLVALGVAALSLLLFAAGFERRQTGSRRMVLTAVMIALCIAGRFVPLFKPVAALTILAGMYMGAEAGFLTGALAAALSNFFFGQGPWTPFQMMAWGLIGLIAGYLAVPLKRCRPLLLVFALLAAVFYSLMMDVWTVLWYSGAPSWDLYAAAFLTALPHTALYAASNVLFLALLATPVGRKLERVRVKYGL